MPSKLKRLFWDIETSPNLGFFWKPGYKVRIPPANIVQEKAIICICWKWEGHKRVFSLTWDKGNDKTMVQQFMGVAAEADELVAHNGDGFDIKWFNTQCLQHGVQPLPGPKTIDTLTIARRRFYLNSNSLDYLAQLLLGRGKHSVPYETWKAIVLENDPKSLVTMVDYCKEDVRIVEEVWEKLSPFHTPKTHAGVFEGKPKWSCAHCGSFRTRRNKRRVTAKGTEQHTMVCKDCKKYYTISDRSYRDYLIERP